MGLASGVMANIIWVLHMLLIVWLVYTPLFSTMEPMLVLHLFMVPFIAFHWILHDDTCALTLIEQKLRGLDPMECKDKSFFFNLVSPVYKIENETVSKVAWVAAVLLWLITVHRVMKRPAMVPDMFVNAKRAFCGEPPILPRQAPPLVGKPIESPDDSWAELEGGHLRPS